MESLLLKVHKALMNKNFHHRSLSFIGLFAYLPKTYQHHVQMLCLDGQISSSSLMDYGYFANLVANKTFKLSLYKVLHSSY